MKHKIDRNDDCFCGSGKKIKKCCKEPTVDYSIGEIADFQWRALRELQAHVVDKHLTPYAQYELPLDIVEQAFSDFLQEDLTEEVDLDILFINCFLPWFLFNWIPQGNFGLEKFDGDKTIALNYADIYGHKLNSSEKRFIEAMDQTYYSFYVVQEVEFEKKIVVKDMLLSTKHSLKEKLATHSLKPGSIIFSRILNLDNQSIFIGMSPYTIPVRLQQQIISFKRWLMREYELDQFTPAVLKEVELDMLDFYFSLLNTSFKKPPLALVNTDGEIIQYAKTYFELTLSPEAAVKQLLPLTLSKNSDDFLNDATRDKSKNITYVELPWLKKTKKNPSSTLMGQITIDKNKLILETNSEKRTTQGKKLLNKYLSDFIIFQKTILDDKHELTELQILEKNNVLQLPDFKEKIAALAQEHWENWFDQPIPALENQTPREASKTTEGRERLEALLRQYECFAEQTANKNLYQPDFEYLRKELALDET